MNVWEWYPWLPRLRCVSIYIGLQVAFHKWVSQSGVLYHDERDERGGSSPTFESWGTLPTDRFMIRVDRFIRWAFHSPGVNVQGSLKAPYGSYSWSLRGGGGGRSSEKGADWLPFLYIVLLLVEMLHIFLIVTQWLPSTFFLLLRESYLLLEVSSDHDFVFERRYLDEVMLLPFVA